MKKFILMGLLLAIVSITATGCGSCQSENKKQGHENVVKPLALTPEHCISTDREAISLRTPKEHTLLWMQTSVTLTSFLTDEAITDATVMEITNGFQTQWPEGEGINTKVTLISTNTMATDSLVINGDFFLDNHPLNDKPVNLTFKQAVERILQANCPTPKTRVILLRSPVGPVYVSDAYYIARDCKDAEKVAFVNARTGAVTTYNPAFGEPDEVQLE